MSEETGTGNTVSLAWAEHETRLRVACFDLAMSLKTKPTTAEVVIEDAKKIMAFLKGEFNHLDTGLPTA